MKILLVINNLGMGGAENMLVRLADSLADKGHTVKIAILSTPISVQPNRPDIEVINFNAVGKKGLLKATFELRNIIKSFNPDVVHSHLFRSNFISRLVRLTLPIKKLICTEHSTSVGGVKQAIFYRATDMLADINTNVSAEAVDSYIRKYAVKKGRMINIPNGVDIEKFKLSPSIRLQTRNDLLVHDAKIILAVGRLVPAKNYANLLNSIAILKKSGRTDFKAFIVGEGPLYDELKSLISELRIEDFVELLGPRDNINYLMQAADLYVMSSSWEGLPMVILEAMASERVVVSTKCGGVENLLKDSGFTVAIDNSEALAHQISLVLDMSESERNLIGAKARKYIICNNTLEKNTDAYIELYQSNKK